MAKLTNYTYWQKNGVVEVASSFVEDEQYRKDGWIKSSRGAMEWYKRSLAKQAPAPAAAEPTADGGGAVLDRSYARGYDAGFLDGYVGVDHDWVARHEARQAELEAQLASVQAQRDAAVAAVQPFDTLWADWFTYCMSGDSKYHNILQWLIGEHSVDKVEDLIRIASDNLRAQLGQQDVG